MNNTSNFSVIDGIIQDDKLYPRYIAIIAASFAILFSFIGTLGNALTVIAFTKYKKLRQQPTTIFIINLTISDLMLSSICLPLLAIDYLTNDVISGIFCKISPLIFYGNMGVSLFSLMAIAINRYILIVKSEIHNNIYTTQNIMIIIMLTWLLSYALLLPMMFEIWGIFGFDKKTMICKLLKKDNDFANPKTVLIIIGFFLPCTVIIFSYYQIYQKIKENRVTMLSYSTNQTTITSTAALSNAKKYNREAQITKLMFIIFIGFLACFLPTVLVNIIDNEGNYPIFHIGDSIASWASVVINPFIYVSTNKLYKTAYKRLFLRIFNKDSESSHDHENTTTNQPQPLSSHQAS